MIEDKADCNLVRPDKASPAQGTSRALSAQPAIPPTGMIESYGFHEALDESASGWFVCGWIRHWETSKMACEVDLHFGGNQVKGSAAVWCYSRPDLKDDAVGILLFLKTSGIRPRDPLVGIDFLFASGTYSIPALAKATLLSGPALAARIQSFGARVFPMSARQSLLRKIAARPYSGTNTMASLANCVQVHIDEVILCPPSGVFLKGWILSKPGTLRSIRLRNEQNVATIDLEKSVKIARPDVIASVGANLGVSDVRCGFAVYVPNAVTSNSELYLEIETSDLEIGYYPLPKDCTTGFDGIQRILADVNTSCGNLSAIFGLGVGQAIAQINHTRISKRRLPVSQVYGSPESCARCSLIIPLYRRIDFAEYQIALFSQLGGCRYDFIYVLDDPSRANDAHRLFTSIYYRFGLPFRVLYLDENIGFAAASNVGLREAAGEYVCFFNSDVIPGDSDWAHKLISRLEATPDLGAIGPLLLYGDGSVQHEGMNFVQLREFDDWFFCDHPRKGLKRSSASGLRKCVAITGACLMMKRALAIEMNGFDEGFVIGDFEDSDLCLRLRDRGMFVGVDLDVALYHLERQSQIAPNQRWRLNLTLYNAWLHQQRWAAKIGALADQPDGPDTLGAVRSSIHGVKGGTFVEQRVS